MVSRFIVFGLLATAVAAGVVDVEKQSLAPASLKLEPVSVNSTLQQNSTETDRIKRTIGVPYPFSLLYPLPSLFSSEPVVEVEPTILPAPIEAPLVHVHRYHGIEIKPLSVVAPPPPPLSQPAPLLLPTYPRTFPTSFIPPPPPAPIVETQVQVEQVLPEVQRLQPLPQFEAISPFLTNVNSEIAARFLETLRTERKGKSLLSFKPIKSLLEKKKLAKTALISKLVPAFLKKKAPLAAAVPAPTPLNLPLPIPIRFSTALPAPITYQAPLPAPITYHAPLPAPITYHAPLPAPITYRAPLPAPIAYQAPVPAPVAVHAAIPPFPAPLVAEVPPPPVPIAPLNLPQLPAFPEIQLPVPYSAHISTPYVKVQYPLEAGWDEVQAVPVPEEHVEVEHEEVEEHHVPVPAPAPQAYFHQLPLAPAYETVNVPNLYNSYGELLPFDAYLDASENKPVIVPAPVYTQLKNANKTISAPIKQEALQVNLPVNSN